MKNKASKWIQEHIEHLLVLVSFTITAFATWYIIYGYTHIKYIRSA